MKTKWEWVKKLTMEISYNIGFVNFIEDPALEQNDQGADVYRCDLVIPHVPRDAGECRITFFISDFIADEVFDSYDNLQTYTHYFAKALKSKIMEECR